MLKKLPLWLANPGTKRPDIENCILWQFTHNGKVNGIAENIVDINMFYGNMKEFRNFIKKIRMVIWKILLISSGNDSKSSLY